MFHFKKLIFSIVLIGFSSAQAGSYEDFFEAIESDNPRVIQNLLQRGFDPNSVNPKGQFGLIVAIRTGATKAAALLIDTPATRVEIRTVEDESALMLASLKGYLDLCKKLIARDADVNKPGWTPLHYAAANGHVDVLKLLIENHAYIDAESPNLTTPLMMAARYGSPAAVKVLLEAGADPKLKNSLGLSALDFSEKGAQSESLILIGAAIRKLNPAAW